MLKSRGAVDGILLIITRTVRRVVSAAGRVLYAQLVAGTGRKSNGRGITGCCLVEGRLFERGRRGNMGGAEDGVASPAVRSAVEPTAYDEDGEKNIFMARGKRH